jgi:hypothetical protein
MSNEQRTTVTRRAALRTSLTALLATGAVSALPAAHVAAQAPQPAPALATIIDTDHLRADSLDALAAYKAANATSIAATDALLATLSPSQRDLWEIADHAAGEADSAGGLLEFTETVRHLPGLAPILWALRQDHPLGHLDNIGRCCMPDA